MGDAQALRPFAEQLRHMAPVPTGDVPEPDAILGLAGSGVIQVEARPQARASSPLAARTARGGLQTTCSCGSPSVH
jgi:hypothetical protein